MEILRVLFTFLLEVFTSILQTIFGRKVKDVKGKVVLISGTGRGLGRELAIQFSKLGSIVICVDINTAENEETLKLLENDKCFAYTCDITDYNSVVQLHEKVVKDVGPVDILLNNAGILYVFSVLEETPETLKRVVDVNFVSHMWMIRVFIQDMIERNSGHIVAISSLGGLVPIRTMDVYSATKHAVVGLMMSLQQDFHFQKKDIKFTTVCPHIIKTPIVEERLSHINMLIPKLSTSEAGEEIVKGIREELPIFTVKKWLSWLASLAMLLPINAIGVIGNYISGNYKPEYTSETRSFLKNTYKLK